MIFWTIAPLLGIFAVYYIRKPIENDAPNESIRHFSEMTKIEIQGISSEEMYRRAMAIGSNIEGLKNLHKKKWLLTLVVLVSISWILLVLNWAKGFVPGWYVLIIIGVFTSYLFYYDSEIQRQINHYEEEWSEGDNSNQNISHKKRQENSKKVAIYVLLGSLALSANWAWQVTSSINQTKQTAVNEILSMQGDGWCNAFYNVDVSSAGDVSKTGGWPCITVGSVSNFTYSKNGKDPQMCADFLLDQNNGSPDQPQQVEKSYKSINICRLQNIDESWSKQDFSDALYASIKADLPILAAKLCQVYIESMDSVTRASYC